MISFRRWASPRMMLQQFAVRPGKAESSSRTSTGPADRRQGIAHLVSDIRRQLSQGRQTVGPAELLLDPLPLGQILEDRHQSHRRRHPAAPQG